MLLRFFVRKGDFMTISTHDIEKVNELLEKGGSLNKLDKNGLLGCSRRAFCNNARKLGYIFNKAENKFISNESDIKLRSSKSVEIKDNEDKHRANQSLSLKALDERLKILEDLIVSHNDTKVTPDLKLDNSVHEDITARGIKASKHILNEFDSLCKKYPQYNKQALFGQALLEFIEKYK